MAKNKGMVAGKGGAKSAAPTEQTFNVSLTLKKETPGAWCYEEDAPEGATADDKVIGSIYIRKAKAAKKYQTAEVTVVLK